MDKKESYDDYYDEDHNQDQQKTGEQAQEQKPIEPEQPKKIIPKQSTILLNRTHSKEGGQTECSYCGGKRNTFQGVEENLSYHKTGFTCTKLTVDDYEKMVNQGFTRCGTYCYIRDMAMSCCEPYSYRVDADQFIMSDSQKKVMKRFHNYLNYGDIHKPKKEKEEEKKTSKELEKEHEKQKLDGMANLVKQSIEENPKIREAVISKEIDITKHRVYFNKNLGCMSSNLVLISSKQIKEQSEEIVKTLRFTYNNQPSNITLEKNYINIFNPCFPKAEPKQQKPQKDKKPKQQKEEIKESHLKQKVEENKNEQTKPFVPPPNYYTNYIKSFREYDIPNHTPAHIYTIEIHKSIGTDELYEMYVRWEKAVHKKDRDRDQMERFVCNSPVFDPQYEKDFLNMSSPHDYSALDKMRTFKDEGIFPGYGSFHMYHRIDGKLVAVGCIDILKTMINSGYYFYDPDYSFLTLGVMGAIREIEYMRLIKEQYNQRLKWYELGEMVIQCPKVNYKINYQPGYVVCPRTKNVIPWEQCKEKVQLYTQLTVEEKKQMVHVQLDDQFFGDETPNEALAKALRSTILEFPLLYEESYWITYSQLSEGAQKILIDAIDQLIQEMGFDLFNSFVFELKFKKKDPEPVAAQQESQQQQQ